MLFAVRTFCGRASRVSPFTAKSALVHHPIRLFDEKQNEISGIYDVVNNKCLYVAYADCCYAASVFPAIEFFLWCWYCCLYLSVYVPT